MGRKARRGFLGELLFDLVCVAGVCVAGLVALGVVWLVRPALPELPLGRPHYTAPTTTRELRAAVELSGEGVPGR